MYNLQHFFSPLRNLRIYNGCEKNNYRIVLNYTYIYSFAVSPKFQCCTFLFTNRSMFPIAAHNYNHSLPIWQCYYCIVSNIVIAQVCVVYAVVVWPYKISIKALTVYICCTVVYSQMRLHKGYAL